MTVQFAADQSYPTWVEHVFSHAVRPHGNAWYFDLDAPYVSGPPITVIGHMTRLFADPEPALDFFADDQIAQGLYYVISPGASDYMHHLYDVQVPAAARMQCFTSMYTLFERIFAPRCAQLLSHIDEPGTVPMNGVCYMWWDILATRVGRQDHGQSEINAAILSTLARTLELPSVACQEAALHGLGHTARYAQAQVNGLIDEYLRRDATLRPELARYAQAARSGCVL
ncbi:MAG: hypothetical protein AB7G15_20245 [Alphaproteobacteria bacterium]